ncbi:Ubiquinone/menaquinone biosynthesis C-methyltransferase UbiE [bacterium HR34]|nr:Ubiquinone/menaquinone biosynthesis C-methyltransferase UbiE [bacterium HR34]
MKTPESKEHKKTNDYDYRIVEYEKLYKIPEENLNYFIDIIGPQPDDEILDLMGGYGSISKRILKRNPNIKITLLDKSEKQLKLAEKEGIETTIKGDALSTPFKDNTFTKVIIKQGIHEIPKEKQVKLFQECFRILKPEGKLFIWNAVAPKELEEVFREFIKEKDKLAGYLELAEKRYFPTKDEIIKLLEESNFEILEEKDVERTLSLSQLKDDLISKERLEGKSDKEIEKIVNEKIDKLKEFAKVLVERTPSDKIKTLKEKLKYEETPEGDIRVNYYEVMIVAKKKSPAP